MFLEQFQNYNSCYEKGAKKISFRSSYPKIIKEPIDLKLEKTVGNYNLFYNQKGLLLHSVHLEKDRNYKVIYGFDKKSKLISAMKLVSEKNTLLSLSEFIYDDKGRIETESCRFYYNNPEYNETEERIHTYPDDNKEEVFITNYNDEDDEHTFYFNYDSNNRVIEDKLIRNEKELVWWYKNEYDKGGNLIRKICFDENGMQYGIYEYLTYKNGQESGYKFKSKDTNYLREYIYTLNDKGHWINQAMMTDGEPRYFFERTIDYY